MVIFNSYVKLPGGRFEGRGEIHGIHGSEVQQFHPWVHTNEKKPKKINV